MWFRPGSFLPSLSPPKHAHPLCPSHYHVAIMWKSVGILNINCTFILGKQNMKWINHGVQGCLDSYPLSLSAFMCCGDVSQEINSGQSERPVCELDVCVLYVVCHWAPHITPSSHVHKRSTSPLLRLSQFTSQGWFCWACENICTSSAAHNYTIICLKKSCLTHWGGEHRKMWALTSQRTSDKKCNGVASWEV